MSTATMPAKTSWADEVDDLDSDAPQIRETVDKNGIITIVEFTTNEEGKKVKITRRIRRTLTKTSVNPEVAARKSWAKFGADKGKPPGPDKATTAIGETVNLKLMAGGQKVEPEPDQETDIKKQLEGKKIQCRLCKAAHFTAKCPYKDSLGSLGLAGADALEDGMPPTDDPTPLPPTGGKDGKYVPPSRRNEASASSRAGETMGRGPGGMNRDDMPTLRVTNVSEDAEEDDLRELFAKFGSVARVYVGKDRETGIGKGYAFVSFQDKASAERALEKVHGKGYDNLILNVQWSQPREQRPGGA
ncbi:translation initiation factor eIF3 subunit g [Tulasnella sp. JGI-2019a]|nr:translation initiation factor eIF3 subunit g [Tulasnella sp. JGI-2019a]KAG8994328.1 translation initiation factor eIF3 subunit g [Tulasnella sp. JGI-2019a]KAG9024768.1 translation initiation factor eIF3 subunit g [Tulasnella sp. JGI-2019a]